MADNYCKIATKKNIVIILLILVHNEMKEYKERN